MANTHFEERLLYTCFYQSILKILNYKLNLRQIEAGSKTNEFKRYQSTIKMKNN